MMWSKESVWMNQSIITEAKLNMWNLKSLVINTDASVLLVQRKKKTHIQNQIEMFDKNKTFDEATWAKREWVPVMWAVPGILYVSTAGPKTKRQIKYSLQFYLFF